MKIKAQSDEEGSLTHIASLSEGPKLLHIGNNSENSKGPLVQFSI